MIKRQKQSLEAFVRVQAFLASHPMPGPLTYEGPRETLDQVVRRIREHGGMQIAGRQLSQGELRHQERLIRQLVTRHIRPLVAIARTQIEPDSDVRLPRLLRMPSGKLGVTRFVQACDSMIDIAREFEATFLAHRRPADFLARFIDARDALVTSLSARAKLVGDHVGARAGLQWEMIRGRRAVEHLDALVREAFDGDEATLSEWRVARRVHLMSVRSARAAVEVDAVAA